MPSGLVPLHLGGKFILKHALVYVLLCARADLAKE